MKQKIKRFLQTLGPGFITGSADDDPSGIGTYSIAGAQYGPLLLWLIPFQLPLMYAMQHMSARIGLITGKGLAENMKLYFPKPLLYSCIFILVIANIINIGANISMMAASLHLVFGHHIHIWATITTISIVLMQVFISYQTYSKILLFFSTFLCSYAITAIITTDNWLEVLYYICTPYLRCDKEFLLVVAGFIGTTISPYLFFWQTSQEIEEKRDNTSKQAVEKIVKQMSLDTFVGMFFSQLMSLFIVLTCYSALYKNGITHITSAHDAALALKPFAGDYAYLIFAIGIIGSGLLGIPVLAGSSAYALAELCKKTEGLSYKFHEARFFYSVIIASTFIGLFINFIGINPIKALLYAAVVNCIVAVPFVAFVLILANKKELLKEHTNGLFFNTMGGITLALMLMAVILVIIC